MGGCVRVLVDCRAGQRSRALATQPPAATQRRSTALALPTPCADAAGPPLTRPAGYRVYSLAGNTLSAGCSVSHSLKGCSSLNQRLVAVATDPSCVVRAFVLGDAKCSSTDEDALAFVQG